MQACAQAFDVFSDCGLGNVLNGYSLKMTSRIVRIVAPVAAVSLLVASATAAGAASYDLSKGSATGMSGVSPFAMEIDGNTDRVFHSALTCLKMQFQHSEIILKKKSVMNIYLKTL